jgi:hypothetical protein
MNIVLKSSKKQLVEQAWILQKNLVRSVEAEKQTRSSPLKYVNTLNFERLNSLQMRAYSRYLRRLKNYWS